MPTRLLILLAALAPIVFWLRFFYKRDKLNPEPKKLIIKAFIFGALMVIPAGLIESWIGYLIPAEFIILVIVAPIVEELLKFLGMKRSIGKHKAFDEPIDGIIYAAAVGLGFASVENIFYVREAYQTGMMGTVAIIRAIVTIPWHAIFAAMWGYAYSLVKFNKKLEKKHILFRWLVLGMGLHAGLNFLTQVQIWGTVGMIGLVVLMWVLFGKRVRKALETRTEHPGDE